MQISYRNDLDGIRAIAVIAVLLFHLNFSIFEGGFVGVDVFFVLSGFLMTAILDDAQGPRFQVMKDFYLRRMRRILPVAIFVLLVTAICVFALFDPFQIKSFMPHFIGAATFTSNFTFWAENSYFASDLFRPNLHYWSLGVEIQYYLIFPFLMLFLKRRIIWFLLFFIVAQSASYLVTNLSPKTAFFILPFRMGEFLIGSFAYYISRLNGSSRINRLADFWVLLGLVAIFYSILTFDKNTPFPGVHALVPCLGTALLIAFGRQAKLVSSLYDNGPFRHIGKISYSLYLWHFPIIFIAITHFDIEITPVTAAVMVLITWGLSELSYKYVETPFRRPAVIGNRVFFRSATAVMVMTVALVAAIPFSNGFAFRYPENIQAVFASMSDRSTYRCGKLNRLIDPFGTICALHQSSEPRARVLLWGDSHADAFKPAFLEVVPEVPFSLYLNTQNCSAGDFSGQCSANNRIIDQIKRLDIDQVVLHSSLSAYQPAYHSNMESIITELVDLDVEVQIIYPMPIFTGVDPRRILKTLEKGEEASPYKLEKSQYHSDIDDFLVFKNRIQPLFPNVQFHETYGVLCPDEQCKSHENYRTYYFDSHHLTQFGASKFIPLVQKVILGQ